jgi:plastocyanin
MMKVIIAVVVLVLVFGGYYLFGSTNTAVAPEPAPVVENNDEGTTVAPSEEAPQVRAFTVEGRMFSFTPNTMNVNVGDTVRVTFKNVEGKHDWVLDAYNVRTQIIAAGTEETIEFVADKAGTFEYYCSVGNHRAQGMKGTLTVE